MAEAPPSIQGRKVHDSIGVRDEESCDDKDSKVVYEGSGDDDDEDYYESGEEELSGKHDDEIGEE